MCIFVLNVLHIPRTRDMCIDIQKKIDPAIAFALVFLIMPRTHCIIYDRKKTTTKKKTFLSWCMHVCTCECVCMHVRLILNCNETAQNPFFYTGSSRDEDGFLGTYLQLIVHDFKRVDSHSNFCPFERKPKY